MHLRWIPHVVVRISAFHLVKYRESLLKLALEHLVLGLERVIELKVGVEGGLLHALDLVDGEGGRVIEVEGGDVLLSTFIEALEEGQVLLLFRSYTAKGLEFACVHLITTIKSTNHCLRSLVDSAEDIFLATLLHGDPGHSLSHAWVHLSVITIPVRVLLLKLAEHADCRLAEGLVA